MTEIQITSALSHPELQSQLLRVFTRASAMGLLGQPKLELFTPKALSHVIRDLRACGFGLLAHEALQPLLTGRVEWVIADEAARALAVARDLAQALEDTPAPGNEWPVVRSTLASDEALGVLLRISNMSLRRYADGSRDTPADVAARLHWIALVLGDLRGAYNEAGCSAAGWWSRARAQLQGRTPLQALARVWSPDSAEARKVRALAAGLWHAGSIDS